MGYIDVAPVVESTEAPAEKIVDSVSSEYKEFTPLLDRFGLDKKDNSRDNMMRDIWEWAKSRAEAKDKDSILWELTKLENRIGSPSGTDAPWTKMSTYISTYNRMRDAEEQLKKNENA